MSIVQPPEAHSIMAIAAHPDDIESWCAGTLLLAHDRGAEVRLLLVTSGEHGTSDPHATAEQVAVQREQEAHDAAEILGISLKTLFNKLKEYGAAAEAEAGS